VSDGAGVARVRSAISRFFSAGVPILEDVSVALLGAAQRVGDLGAATATCRQIRRRGGNLDPELLTELWHWAKSQNDEESAAWLHAELTAAQQAAAKAAALATPPPVAAEPQIAAQTPTQKE
jgi:hypothetical protein